MIYSQCLSETLTALSASNQKGHACFKSDPPKSLTVLERKKEIFPVHSFRMAVFFCHRISQKGLQICANL